MKASIEYGFWLHPTSQYPAMIIAFDSAVSVNFCLKSVLEHGNTDRRSHGDLLFVFFKNPKSRVFGLAKFFLQLIFILLFLYDYVINIVFFLFFVYRSACMRVFMTVYASGPLSPAFGPTCAMPSNRRRSLGAGPSRISLSPTTNFVRFTVAFRALHGSLVRDIIYMRVPMRIRHTGRPLYIMLAVRSKRLEVFAVSWPQKPVIVHDH